MKIPVAAGIDSLGKLDGIALNQVISDWEIIREILRHSNEDNEGSSAIKIGDVWLSIPSKILAVPAKIPGAEGTPEFPMDWYSYDHFIKSGEKGRELLKALGYPTNKRGVTRDPLEKLVGWQSSMENNIRPSESVGRLTSLVVDNNKPPDKLIVLQFECTSQSIHNNIRPLMAQFLLAPFLPVLNADLSRLVQPHDENPYVFMKLQFARLTERGEFTFMPSEFSMFDAERNDNEDAGPAERAIIASLRKRFPAEAEFLRDFKMSESYFLNRAYWLTPFYIQLVDFSVASKGDKRAAFDLTLVIRVIDPTPAYGGIPTFLKNEKSVRRQMDLQDILENAGKGENIITQRIAKMFHLNELGDQDSPLALTRVSEYQDYNLFESGLFEEASKVDPELGNTSLPSYAVSLRKRSGTNNVSPDIINSTFLNIKTPKKWNDILYNEKIGNSEISLAQKYRTQMAKLSIRVLNKESTKGKIYGETEEVGASIYTTAEVSDNYQLKRKDKGIILKTLPRSIHNREEFKVTIDGASSTKNFAYPLYVSDRLEFAKNKDYIPNNVKSKGGGSTLTDRNEFTAVQYNVRRLFAPGDRLALSSYRPDSRYKDYEVRKRLFSLFIAKQNPDIVALQELGDSSKGIEEIKEIINDEGIIELFRPDEGLIGTKYSSAYVAPPRHALGDAVLGLGLLTKFSIVGQPEAIYPEDNRETRDRMEAAFADIPGDIGSKLHTRPVMKVTLEKDTGNIMVVFVCHLKSRIHNAGNPPPEQLRKYESENLIREIAKLPDNIPFMIMGDLNYGYYPEPPDKYIKYPNPLLGLRSNVMLPKKGRPDTLEYKFRVLRTGWDIVRKTTDKGYPEFNNALDIITCSDYASMCNLASGKVETITHISDDIYKEHYLKVYPEIFSNRKGKELVNAWRKITMFPSISRSMNDSPAAIKRMRSTDQGKGTFFDETKRNKTNPWSFLDHILYSHHFFQEGASKLSFNNKGQEGVITVYNDGFKIPAKIGAAEEYSLVDRNIYVLVGDEFKVITGDKPYPNPKEIPSKRRLDYIESVKRPSRDTIPRDYSDHFPINSRFMWKNGRTQIPPPEGYSRIKKQIVYANPRISKEISAGGFNAVEFFPYPTWDGGIIDKAFSEQTNLDKLILISSRSLTRDSIPFSLTRGPDPYNYTIHDSTAVILGIYYSEINRKYIFIAHVDKKKTSNMTGRSVRPEKRETDVTRRNPGRFIVFIVAQSANSTVISSLIGDLKSESNTSRARYNLSMIFLDEFNAWNEKSDYGIVTIGRSNNQFKLGTSIIPSTKDLNNLSLPKRINRNKFNGYFMYDEQIFKDVAPLNAAEDLSYNISQSLPFRNYYLPLLKEFSTAPREEKFDWNYTYDVDPLSPLLYDFSPQSDTSMDTRLLFSRKLTSKGGKSIVTRIKEAIRTISLLNEGSDADRAKYIGSIAQKMLNGGSPRIKLIISREVANGKDTRAVLEQIESGLGDYNNILTIEVLMYILSLISQIMFLLDSDHETYIRDMLGKNETFNIKETVYQNSETATIAYIHKEVDRLAFKGMSKGVMVKLDGERRKIREYLLLEANYYNAARINNPDGTDEDERRVVFNGPSGQYDRNTDSLKGDIKALVNLYRAARKNITERIAKDYADPNTKSRVNFTRIS